MVDSTVGGVLLIIGGIIVVLAGVGMVYGGLIQQQAASEWEDPEGKADTTTECEGGGGSLFDDETTIEPCETNDPPNPYDGWQQELLIGFPVMLVGGTMVYYGAD